MRAERRKEDQRRRERQKLTNELKEKETQQLPVNHNVVVVLVFLSLDCFESGRQVHD